VAVAVPESTLSVFEERLLEAVKLPCPEEDGRISQRAIEPIVEFAGKAGAVALGPGLGRGSGPKELVARLLRELEAPVVVDADALFELEPFERSAPTVLTPHEGELARLLGEESRWVAAHRLEAVKRGAEQFGCVCLLKGADTLVDDGGGAWVCSLGTPALATAGSGDVLTGVIASFLAKGLEGRVAAAAGAVACQLASREIPQAGAIAGDVIGALPAVLN
jgi:NAD(P)H-hydrate epimerase